MSALNRGLTAAFDLILGPLATLPPLASLAIVSLVTAAVAMLVVRATSNQTRVRAAKNRMYAALLEMRLFNDDLGAIARATGDALVANARYLGASLTPILWLVIPFGLATSHLEAYYGSRGLPLGEPALVTAHLRDGSVAPATLTLDAPPAIRVDTPAALFPDSRDVLWRVVGLTPGRYDVTIATGGEMLTKSVAVGDAMMRRSPTRPPASWFAELSAPSEPPVPATSAFDRVTVSYPSRDVLIAGWRAPWLLVYLGLTVAFGLVIGRVFHIEI
jgi:type II secretory pathway pseudopilin PulG